MLSSKYNIKNINISCCLLLDFKKSRTYYTFIFQTPGGQGSKLQYLCVPVYKYIYLSSFFFFQICIVLYCVFLCRIALTWFTPIIFFVHFLHSINKCNLSLWCFFFCIFSAHYNLWICLHQYFASISVIWVFESIFWCWPY